MCLSEPGFCGYIFQSPVCLAFCADSSCEEYFSTSLAAPLACFPCSFFGWRVCFFFVSVNIISSRPRSVETVVGRASDPSFSGTEHVCVCVCLCDYWSYRFLFIISFERGKKYLFSHDRTKFNIHFVLATGSGLYSMWECGKFSVILIYCVPCCPSVNYTEQITMAPNQHPSSHLWNSTP